MSIHYIDFRLNTYRVVPYFEANIPSDYPLDLVLQKVRQFRALPSNLKRLSALSKRWAERVTPDSPIVTQIKDWYDKDGYELNPDTGKRMSTKEVEESWTGNDPPDVKVTDIPMPKGGFPDPDKWEVIKTVEPNEDDKPPSYEQLLKDIASHGREAVSTEYNIPIEKLPNPGERKLAAQLSIDANQDNVPKLIGVYRDWDTLRSIVVGRVENNVFAPVPWQPSVKGLPKEGGVTYEQFAPEQYALAIKQLDKLCELLESEGITVYRPPVIPLEQAMTFPVGLTQLYARESFTMFESVVVINQARTPYRRKESRAIEPFFNNALASGKLKEVLNLPPAPDDVEDSLPDDPLPYLEGGDVFRLGKDVIVTMSGIASSEAGIGWLSEALSKYGTEVWIALLKEEYEHGDYVLMPIREGLCVANRRGFVDNLLPTPITDWDCVEITASEADPGMGANGIVVRENLVMMPTGNKRITRALERKGVDVVEVPFDGVAFFQGAIDCATSELWREK